MRVFLVIFSILTGQQIDGGSYATMAQCESARHFLQPSMPNKLLYCEYR